jgi:acetoin utilization deacetylase AcuC-like enzyme
MKVFWDPVQLEHTPQFFLQRGVVRRNFEVPARAEALLASCQAMGLEIAVPGAVPLTSIEAVHEPAYLEFLRDAPAAWAKLAEHGPELVPNLHPTPEMLAQGARPSATVVGQLGWFTADTSSPFTETLWPAALAAAAGAIAAADEAAAGRHAYALARPPGHHAYRARAGGHCFLNNAAIAAQRLRDNGADRVAVLDIDSHHGNGTQGIFWERGDVFFASLHGDPNGYYPWYIGHQGERGAGLGEGCNLNIPFAHGTGDAAWLAGLRHALAAIARFGAEALVVSLGFDASEHEPLHFLSVTEDGFARAAGLIGETRLPCALVQEGGYNTDVIGPLLTRFVTAL